MEEVWERLRKATNKDAPLVAFLQRMLTLDPAARADFAALCSHPYLQTTLPQQATLTASSSHDSAQHLTASLAVSAAGAVSAVVMPEQDDLRAAVRLILGITAEEAAQMEPVPGSPFLVWDPSRTAVCDTGSGVVYR